MKRNLAACTIASSILTGSCSSASGPSAAARGDAGAAAADVSQYGLTGTFVGAGYNAEIAGAIVGTTASTGDPSAPNMTQWNGEGTPDLSASGGIPTPLKVTASLASGETAEVEINLSMITTAPAAGTFTCASSNDYELSVVFLVTKGDAGAEVTQYIGTTCSFVLDTPERVVETSNFGTVTVYLAHGSLVATMTNVGMSGAAGDGTTGTMKLVW